MFKLYNTQVDFSTKIKYFFLNVFPSIRKTQLKFIPDVIFGIIDSESSTASDIAKKLKGNYSSVKLDSRIKRIKRRNHKNSEVIVREHMIKNNMNTLIRMFLLIVRDNKLNN